MSLNLDRPFLYPSVPGLPGTTTVPQQSKEGGAPGEFGHVFDQEIKRSHNGATDLSQAKQPLKFSAHASQRLRERNITLDSQLLSRVSEAVDQAAAKGLDDTLVLTDQAALIVSARNRTVITALDRGLMTGNVFTNIDGAVVI